MKCRVVCPILEESKTFKSFNTGKLYKIRQKVTCNSSWVIYLCTCRKCGGQYVGKSETTFKKRHSNHKQEIKKEVGGLGHHYGGSGGCGYQNMSIIIIEEVETKTKAYLAEREVFWQHQLRVYVENGSNGHCYRKEV
jgi:predicted GIY-YIG superfamily endonuclease